MRINRLFLQNFLNFQAEDCLFHKNINILQGANAQGKSNLLDGIHYISRAASYRHSKDSELIRWGQEFFRLKALIEKDQEDEEITITYLQGKRGIFHNENRIDTINKHLGHLVTVIFSPEDLYIIKGGPEQRRRFIDEELAQTSEPYIKELYRYKKILNQRNHFLKRVRKGQSKADMLGVYDDQLVASGVFLWEQRRIMLEKIQPLMRLAHRRLTDGGEEIDIHYQHSLSDYELREPPSKEVFSQKLKEKRDEDLIRGFTTIGPHRDDFSIYIDGKDCRVFGSQGQQRTVALSLKIAEVEFLQSIYGQYPILLLDDVLSELDEKRRMRLLELVSQNIQTFITCTDTEDIKGLLKRPHKRLLVDQGQVVDTF